ncbi:MAG: DUF456 domain-containing protein [Wenzhouxiangellaceae bacterium]|nr:DUF456 domain-containing protein [Wenzhouxiangellaceae bacterium]
MEDFFMQSASALGWVLAVVLVVVGLAGALLPSLPGTPIILAGLFLAAWLDGFVRVGFGTLGGLLVLTILSLILDFLATAEGARRFGAGRAAILGATAGLIVGMFFGLPGLLLGPFAGGALGHWLGRATVDSSIRAGVGASVGVLVGTVAKVVIAVAMILWFVLAWWL